MNTLIFRSAILSILVASSFLSLGARPVPHSQPAPLLSSVENSPRPAHVVRSGPGQVYLAVIKAEASQPAANGETDPRPTTPLPAATPTPDPKPAPASPVYLEMGQAYHSQLKETSVPNACGPTSLLMVLDYFKLEEALEPVISRARFSAREGGFDPTCSKNKACMSPGGLVKLAQETYGLEVEAREGWTLEEVHQALADGDPVIADITWRAGNRGVGHFVVIYGVDLDKQTVTYHDPFDGPALQASWADFSASWNGPVDIGDPLMPAGHKSWGAALVRAE